jgi:hypothetical protein
MTLLYLGAKNHLGGYHTVFWGVKQTPTLKQTEKRLTFPLKAGPLSRIKDALHLSQVAHDLAKLFGARPRTVNAAEWEPLQKS